MPFSWTAGLHGLFGPSPRREELLHPILVVNEGFSRPVAHRQGPAVNVACNRPDSRHLRDHGPLVLADIFPEGWAYQHKIRLRSHPQQQSEHKHGNDRRLSGSGSEAPGQSDSPNTVECKRDGDCACKDKSEISVVGHACASGLGEPVKER